jgi:NAD-dependent SIR2 family protein deacetylase
MPVNALLDLLRGRRLVVLTGAGVSTESGIPDYRGPQTRSVRSNPMQWARFVGDAAARRRYWARALSGWPRFAAARPNAGHVALARLEHAGVVAHVITQNVDGLQQAAGSDEVIELHGTLHRVRCLQCGELEPRQDVQERMLALNPSIATTAAELAPDGDAEVDPPADFVVAECRACGGVLKPDVVFFGENVPPAVVQQAYAALDRAEALLVVGSSLAVFSGYRFVRRARVRGLPIAIVNLGPTRGDAEADLCVDAKAGEILPALSERIAGTIRT